MHITPTTVTLVVLAIIVIGGTLASQRTRMGEPFHKRPAAVVLLIVMLIIAAMCIFLATRHGV